MSRRVFGPGRLLATAAPLMLLVLGRAGATPLNLLSGTADNHRTSEYRTDNEVRLS